MRSSNSSPTRSSTALPDYGAQTFEPRLADIRDVTADLITADLITAEFITAEFMIPDLIANVFEDGLDRIEAQIVSHDTNMAHGTEDAYGVRRGRVPSQAFRAVSTG